MASRIITRPTSLPKLIPPLRRAVISPIRFTSSTPKRPPPTLTPIQPSTAHRLLASQRLHRPLSPHLTIYDPHQTWFSASVWTRITGLTLSGLTYLFFITYATGSFHGISLGMVGEFSKEMKMGIKVIVAGLLGYHFWNGVRHLVWDSGRGLGRGQVGRSGVLVGVLVMVTVGGLVGWA
ncbi:succinate dehydrogenase cytochrome b subunit [Pyronema omphalodes]|nr:succinate dehydrogenase cytochrome b subunit [Pyronema omphalodes]